MRKKIFIIAIASLYLLACNSNNRKDYPQLKVPDVARMIDNYKKLIAADVHQVIMQITVDQKQLRKFTAGSERVKLFSAAYDLPKGDIKTTIIIQIGTRKMTNPFIPILILGKFSNQQSRQDQKRTAITTQFVLLQRIAVFHSIINKKIYNTAVSSSKSDSSSGFGAGFFIFCQSFLMENLFLAAINFRLARNLISPCSR
jgi:hypothetical protein